MPLTETDALTKLQRVKANYQTLIKFGYEHAAESCATCLTPGACCTDAHFVNVHITRLEAVAIRATLLRTPRLSEQQIRAVYQRAAATVEKYNLRVLPTDDARGASFAQTYACPLFEKGVGCLVHRRAKPAPCIQHACYENWEDLPPQTVQTRAEHRVEQLNTDVYGTHWAWLPTPLWMCLTDPFGVRAEWEIVLSQLSTRAPSTPRSKIMRRHKTA